MKEVTLKAAIDQIPQVTAFVDEQLEALDCPMKAQMQIDVAIDELFSNIAYYAYPDGDGDATVRVDFDRENRMVSIAFVDHGAPFDPLAQDDPNVTLAAEDRKVGGLGIFLVKKTMDRVIYQRETDANVLTIYKKI